MAPKLSLQARIKRLRSRQHGIITRIGTHNARSKARMEEFMASACAQEMKAKSNHVAQIFDNNAIDIIPIPNFSTELTWKNIMKEEQRLDAMEKVLETPRASLRTAEVGWKSLAAGDWFPVLPGVLQKEASQRKLGIPEANISVTIKRMLAIGDLINDKPPFGGQYHTEPPIKLRIIRLRHRQENFLRRQDDHLHCCLIKYKNLIKDRPKSEHEINPTFVDVIKSSDRPPMEAHLTPENLDKEERCLLEREAWFCKAQMYSMYWDRLVKGECIHVKGKLKEYELMEARNTSDPKNDELSCAIIGDATFVEEKKDWL
ncbi:hypothetical protein BJ508DRAFT_332679 [Ascobolus immersus RN42]|uniref:Uncharacterized protein n=1 Tax=Ascobolus immersus RN42 TaxID=1160509 RepID=A0A3N4HPC8_ASCIM|nr:hypothetical protein BJ508DRAFT_332679 [Ascobolus immersus RN42]